MVLVKSTYACGICERNFPTREEAEVCEARGVPKKSVEVGDIVTSRAGFGWFYGDYRWIANLKTVGGGVLKDLTTPILPDGHRQRFNNKRGYKCPDGDGNCFGPCCTLQFYYVVGTIDIERDSVYRDMHRWEYHLFTGAMTLGSGYMVGTTYDVGHCSMTRIAKPPKFVVEDSKRFIGVRAMHLL